MIRVALGALCLLLVACPAGAPRRPAGGTPPNAAPPVEEISFAAQMQRAERAWLSDHPGEARRALEPILRVEPDHLEARVLLALVYRRSHDAAEKGAWQRVERIIVVKGKLVPFILQNTLLGAAEHYLARGRSERSSLFLEALWRRFPGSDAAARAQLFVAEHAFGARRWQHVLDSCAALARTQAKHAGNRRCAQLVLTARRLRDVGPPAPTSGSHWVWESPQPQGNDLNDLWVGKRGEQVLVGAAGTIVERAPRGAYRLLPALTRWSLRGVSGTSLGALYAVGDGGVILARDARGWRVLRAPAPAQADLSAVWSPVAGQLIAVGDGGEVLHWAAGRFRREQPTKVALYGIWGSGPTDVFAVGGEGTLLRYDGKSWQRLASDAYENLRSVWGVSPSHVLVAGDRRTIIHYNGQRAKESVQGLAHFRGVWGPNKTIAWAVGSGGAILRGGRNPLADWVSESSTTAVELRAIAGRSAREVYAVGQGGTILTRRGRSWRLLHGGSAETLVSVSIDKAGGEALALGLRGRLLSRKAGKWKATTLPVPGIYRALHRSGAEMTAVGHRGLLVRGDGKAYRRIAAGTPEDLLAVNGCGGRLFAAGTRGTMLRLEGDKVTREVAPTGQRLRGLAGCRRPLAVGNRGTIIERRGGTWRLMPNEHLSHLYAIWVDAKESVAMAVGAGGTVLRLQGRRWLRMKTPLAQTLVAIWGKAPNDVYALSAGGNALHYDGKTWHLERSPAACLMAVHGRGPEVIAVGCNGAVLRRVE